MSRHHVAGDHVGKTKRIRPILKSRLPLPCLECGHMIDGSLPWHVAHIIPAALGGQTTLENVSVAHVSCNTAAGAKLGNSIYRRARRRDDGIRDW